MSLCEYCLESNSRDILGLCGMNLDDSIDSGNFSVRDMVFNAVSSNIDEILLINPSANVFVFGN